VKSGTGVLRETVAAPEIEKIGEQLLGGLGWHGVAEIDFRWQPGSEPSLIEVNPRFWGGLTQAVEAGWDYPYLLYRLAVDGRVDKVESHATEVRTETPVMAVLATLHEVMHDESRDLKGRWERAKALFRDHKHAVSDIFKWNDPLPALGVFYPLAVFLKHGKVSTELLVSEGRATVK
jgi:predicted ATP-grasp superfamily ATP-dependent carboligase